jgi:hypothetical protein
VYIVDTSLYSVRVVNRTSGIITTFAGTGVPSLAYGLNGDGGAATSASLQEPSCIALDPVNNLVYITELGSGLVRTVNRTTNIISTFAGGGTSKGDGGPATAASLNHPQAIKIDTVNNKVYIADTFTLEVRVVDRTTNIIDIFVGNGNFVNGIDIDVGT